MSKSLPHILQNTLVKTITIVGIVLVLSWGITQATTSGFEEATKNFSVIGTVSSITEDTISVIDARGSDTQTEDLYNLDITHIKTVETKDYAPLIISDVTVGSTIVAQGVSDDSTYFITRIVLFSEVPVQPQEETLLPTEETPLEELDVQEPVTEEPSTSTEESPTQEESTLDTQESQTSNEVAPEETSSPTEVPIESPTEEVPLVTEASPDTETTTPTVIDTVVDILEDGINDVSDLITSFTDTPTEEVIQTESPPVE